MVNIKHLKKTISFVPLVLRKFRHPKDDSKNLDSHVWHAAVMISLNVAFVTSAGYLFQQTANFLTFLLSIQDLII